MAHCHRHVWTTDDGNDIMLKGWGTFAKPEDGRIYYEVKDNMVANVKKV